MSTKAKPKRLDSKSRTARTSVTLLDGSPTPKVTDNGKVSFRRKPAKKTKKPTKTANELMLEAWKYIWENRHRRLTKP